MTRTIVNYHLLKNKKSSSMLLSLLLLASFCVFIYSLFLKDLKPLTILGLIQFIIGYCLICLKNKQLFSYASVFYLICFFFHYSYPLFAIYDLHYVNSYMYIENFSIETQFKIIRFCILFFAFFPLGTLLCKYKSQAKIFLDKCQCYRIGLILMTVCLFPRLYVDFTILLLYLNGGYNSTFSGTYNDFIVVFSNMFYLGAILAIFGSSEKPKTSGLILLFTIGLIVIGMLGGRRGIKVAYLVAIVFVYFKYSIKLNMFKTLLYIFLGYVMLVLIATFGDIRHTGIFDFSTFFSVFLRNFTYEMFFDQLGEFGYAAYTLGASIEYFPNVGFGYGTNYILSWLEVFPNVGGLLDGFSNKLSYVMKLPSQYQHSLGGSFLGEVFYNFGNLSFIGIIMFGFVFEYLGHSLEITAKKGFLSLSGLICILAFSPSILWIRSVFNEFPRAVIWSLFIIIVLKKVFPSLRQNKA